MRKVYCDRCANKIEVANYYSLGMARQVDTGVTELDLCEPCAKSLKRFLGIDTPGGGYEQLDSEEGGAT